MCSGTFSASVGGEELGSLLCTIFISSTYLAFKIDSTAVIVKVLKKIFT